MLIVFGCRFLKYTDGTLENSLFESVCFSGNTVSVTELGTKVWSGIMSNSKSGNSCSCETRFHINLSSSFIPKLTEYRAKPLFRNDFTKNLSHRHYEILIPIRFKWKTNRFIHWFECCLSKKRNKVIWCF